MSTVSSNHTISQAATLLRAGKLVAFPTETVYGLGADATSDRAVAAIYAAKGRPTFNPLIIHAAERCDLEPLVAFTDHAHRLATAFWPGPLTLVLPRLPNCPISRLASAGLDTLAVRVPDHPIAHALIQATHHPIAAPSANPSGKLSPTTAQHVRTAFPVDIVPLVLDGGACRVGVESTVIACLNETPTVLRMGGIPLEALERVLGLSLTCTNSNGADDDPVHSPGQLLSHYAPRHPLRMNATFAEDDEGLLGFGDDRAIAGGVMRINLSPHGDLTEAAANLFAYLHTLSSADLRGIAVMTIPEQGLGMAINDRLRRATYAA